VATRRIFREIPKDDPELKRLMGQSEPKTKEASLLGDSPEAAQQLKEAILRIDKAVQQIASSGINQRLLVLMLADQTGVSKTQITYVLNALHRLKREYLTQE
jgi:hypothetical protein